MELQVDKTKPREQAFLDDTKPKGRIPFFFNTGDTILNLLIPRKKSRDEVERGSCVVSVLAGKIDF